MPFYDSKALKFVEVCVYMALLCLWNTGSTIFRVEKKKDIENNKGDFKCSFSGSSEKYFDKLHIIGWIHQNYKL